MMSKSIFPMLLILACLSNSALNAQVEPLFTPAESFKQHSRLVTTNFFIWFAAGGGQLSGPWSPVEGRENWTGLPDWWKTQVKQMMMANIDVAYVHLFTGGEEIHRILLFRALNELRSEGYDVPKVGPFLDPLITWSIRPKPDLSTEIGKDTLAAQYIRFYHQYFSENKDPFAADYIAKIEGKPVLTTWHVFELPNLDKFTRSDLEDRLSAEFAAEYPDFNNGIHMVSTALNPPFFSFTDENVAQFEINEYFYPTTFNGLKTVQLKAGYWDQNIRTPGSFLARNGGAPFRDAWAQVDTSFDRVYIESWNEYDEGTGIYAASGNVFIKEGSENPNMDTWSSTGDPFEYIMTTARGAAAFNQIKDLDAMILQSDIPSILDANSTYAASLILRNTGNSSWTGKDGFYLRQSVTDEIQLTESDMHIDDTSNEIPIYRGVFRGRPIKFEIPIAVPDTSGTFITHWQMYKGENPFGAMLTHEVVINPTTSVRSLSDLSVLHFSPNPVDDYLFLNWDDQPSKGRVEIYDLQGKRLIQQALPSQRIGLTNLVSGIYQILIEYENVWYVGKVMKR